ncbi:MAG TPA: hypothetical protein VMZ71_02305 [Gemmataceae bacterium]|nr:hypothetical protein [Gemmataceae bacterium]
MAKTIVEEVLDLQPRPNVDAVIDHFMSNAGGASAFAKMLYDEYTAAPAGSMIRAKIVDLILRRMEKSEERNRRDDFGGLTDEDLRVMAENHHREMAKTLPIQQAEESK